MANDQYQEEFMKDDEFVLRINLDTKETRIYRGSQLVKQVVDEDIEPVEIIFKL